MDVLEMAKESSVSSILKHMIESDVTSEGTANMALNFIATGTHLITVLKPELTNTEISDLIREMSLSYINKCVRR